MPVTLDHPSNAGVLRHLGAGATAETPASESPAQVPDAYYQLGTHPDLVEQLWDRLTTGLPVDCRWVVYRRPVLVHPSTGVLFAFASGTHLYALRLPEPERTEALAAGARRRYGVGGVVWLDLDEIGEQWILGHWHSDESRWCRAAYELAGST